MKSPSGQPIVTTESHTCETAHNHAEHEHAGHNHNHVNAALLINESGKLATTFKLGLGITLAFVIIEFAAGFMANSLALISDAGHNLSDALALTFSWMAVILARRAPTSQKTYGFHRAGILAASLNSITLVLIAAFILFEGVQRLFNAPEVQSWTVVGIATVALVVNLTIARLLHSWSEGDLNVRSAFLHMITDAAASAGVIVAGVAQALTGWAIFDPLISILIGLLVLWSSWGIIKEATNVLLEGIPAGLDMEKLMLDLSELEGVSEVHDLHAWTIGAGIPVLSCHLQMLPTSTLQQATQTVQTANLLLEDKYQIRHATIQIECESCTTPCKIA
ncbi:MAG: cation transporter [Chloroflexi bacterium]|nr:cation transporter [Chloroflexota bacterium]